MWLYQLSLGVVNGLKIAGNLDGIYKPLVIGLLLLDHGWICCLLLSLLQLFAFPY
uniref:Uncharacterized protein n=1 Tax=Rhizophora mucronata TaxID=61149 RepID=A0A2P2P0B1_RHIMU